MNITVVVIWHHDPHVMSLQRRIIYINTVIQRSKYLFIKSSLGEVMVYNVMLIYSNDFQMKIKLHEAASPGLQIRLKV